jgi:hypothetical protein
MRLRRRFSVAFESVGDDDRGGVEEGEDDGLKY